MSAGPSNSSMHRRSQSMGAASTSSMDFSSISADGAANHRRGFSAGSSAALLGEEQMIRKRGSSGFDEDAAIPEHSIADVESGKIWSLIDKDTSGISLINVGFSQLGKPDTRHEPKKKRTRMKVFKRCTALNLSRNKLIALSKPTVVGKAIGNTDSFPLAKMFPNLEVMDLNDNKLTKVPLNLIKLKHLKVLRLSNNQIERFPRVLYFLKSVEQLLVFSNNIVRFPKAPKGKGFDGMSELRELSVANNPLKLLPNLKGLGPNFKKLSAYGCKFEKIGLYHLKGLKEVYIYSNLLTAFPRFDEDQEDLSVIDVSSNQITYLPREVISIKASLTSLNLSHNAIPNLPDELGELTKLKHLRLSDNKLTEFPKQLLYLTKLEELNLSGNTIGSILVGVDRLKKLVLFQATNCGLRKLPISMLRLKNLKRLSISGNPIKYDSDQNKQVVGHFAAKMGSNRLDVFDLFVEKSRGDISQDGHGQELRHLHPLSPRHIPKLKEKVKTPSLLVSSATLLPIERDHKYMSILNDCQVFSTLLQEEKFQLAERLEQQIFAAKEVIFRQGEEGDKFYVIFRGHVTYHYEQDGRQKSKRVGEAFPGEYFGEIALMKNQPRAVTVRAGNKGAVCLTITRKHFEKCVGSFQDALERKFEQYDNLKIV